MSENREEILANFQSITAIDDVGEAIFHLEANDWDLLSAVNNVLGQNEQNSSANVTVGAQVSTADLHPQNAPIPMQRFDFPQAMDFEASTADSLSAFSAVNSVDVVGTGSGFRPIMTRNRNGDVENISSGSSAPSSSSKTEEVVFNVHFNGHIHRISMFKNFTIGDLKLKVQEQTGIQVCRQALKGWSQAVQKEAQNSNTILNSLDIGRTVDLFLTDLSTEGFVGDTNGAAALQNNSRENLTFTLRITLKPSGEEKVLKFPGRHTIIGVKTDVYTVTDIQVRHQKWSGWPNGTSNNTTLADSGIELEHNFILESSQDSKKEPNNSVIDIDSESEEFEDAEGFDDDIFTDNSAPIRNRVKNLIPEPVDDETIGCLQFIENYEERYGIQHPVFFHGSLSDAVKEACQKPARERKLLVVYLHHDESVLTNVFCGQLLGQESIINMFLENFVVYGWDLSIESNANLFLTSISIAVGPSAAATVRSIPVEHMPTILLVAKIRSQCEIFSVIHGNIGLDDLYSSLMEARESYAEQLAVEIREEEERYARERVKMEQDAAYHESLLADRAKEEARRQKEQMLATERKRLESEKAEIEAEKERIRSEAERALPPEPEDTKSSDITKIRVRQPTGEIFERRFLATDTLQTLIHFVTSKGFPIDKFKLISSWPRRDLTALGTDETLKALKLYPQEMVTLEER